MKLKTIEVEGTTYAAVDNGRPIYVDDDGKEAPLDAAEMSQTVKRLNHEAMQRRKDVEALQKQVKAFEGLDDPEAARKALETVQNLDAKKLIDAGEVEKVKSAITKTFQEKLDAEAKARAAAETALRQEKIGGSFARSKFIADKLAVPADFVEARFGSHFSIEDGKVVAKDANGNTIYGATGDVAGFDEALESLVKAYPHRDSILKGTGASGTGARPAGGAGGAKTMSRAEFGKLAQQNPAAAQARMAEGYTLTD